ncbi:MAG: STAS-like domain-containing protein [Bacteroidales bacterium]|jgi:hypothetical protein|nr:STAS-like domain-containing protein [Bacteroidales bacterium]
MSIFSKKNEDNVDKKHEIIIDKQYSHNPGPRYSNQGDYSGEDFYDNFLKEEFEKVKDSQDEKLEINLDGVAGYASSFLDESFGRLVYDFGLDKVKEKVDIVSEEEPQWKDMIENKTYQQWAERKKKNQAPKITI